ncbi:hypothetical protein DFH06DRAFT_468562 [Mycena polygramma]|nr:hypothetical protein DFH06DRAFT_468562 [Mycena polygramma]
MFGLLLLLVSTVLSANLRREDPPSLECPIRARNNMSLRDAGHMFQNHTSSGSDEPILQCDYGTNDAAPNSLGCEYGLATGGDLRPTGPDSGISRQVNNCPHAVGDAASPARCPHINTDGLPLEKGDTSSDGTATACVYTGTPTACIYEPETILSGSPSNCPQSRAFGSDRCPFLNNDGQVLVSGGSTGDGAGDTTSCIYFNSNGAACTYTPENLGSCKGLYIHFWYSLATSDMYLDHINYPIILTQTTIV